jgi:phospholipase/lecithinase/hemolysin
MNIHNRLVRFFVALFTIVVLPAAASAQIPNFDSLYVFGDSLADNGNILAMTKAAGFVPPIPPEKAYFNGRFSNGYVGFEYLWQELSGYAPGSSRGMRAFLAAPQKIPSGAVDFAYGGTGSAYLDQTPGGFWAPGLKGQVELFRVALKGTKPSKRALYAIVTGANDYRMDDYNIPSLPSEVASNTVDAIVRLYQLGARDVMVLDMPDLGRIPANMIDEETSWAATQITIAHNAAQKIALDQLQASLPALNLIQVEVNPLFNGILENTPEALRFVPGLAPYGGHVCLFFGPVSCPQVPTTDFNNLELPFVFWDIVHPTTRVHQLLGGYLQDRLEEYYAPVSE